MHKSSSNDPMTLLKNGVLARKRKLTLVRGSNDNETLLPRGKKLGFTDHSTLFSGGVVVIDLAVRDAADDREMRDRTLGVELVVHGNHDRTFGKMALECRVCDGLALLGKVIVVPIEAVTTRKVH